MVDLSTIRPEDLFPILAGLVALAGAYAYLRLGREAYGPEADWWEIARRAILPQLNRLARRNGWGYAAYQLSKDEYLGRIEEDPETFEKRLYEMGAARMPLAAYKYAPGPDRLGEVGSWAWRPWLFSRRQVHLILFPAEDGGTMVFGHEEANAYNPLTAAQHYLGVGYHPLGSVLPLADLLHYGFEYAMKRVRRGQRASVQ